MKVEIKACLDEIDAICDLFEVPGVILKKNKGSGRKWYDMHVDRLKLLKYKKPIRKLRNKYN